MPQVWDVWGATAAGLEPPLCSRSLWHGVGLVAEVQVGKATGVYLYVVWGDRALGLTLLKEVKCIYLSPCFHERGLLRLLLTRFPD